MVLCFPSCPTVSQEPQESPSSTRSTTTTTTTGFHHPVSAPIPVRSSKWDVDHLSCSPLERFPSPLATSAESVNSLKSSCSSRSSAEREVERAQRRQMLNTSLTKLREESNMPLRKHLLIYNTVKTVQRDLDLLDDEELYCSLVGTNETTTMSMLMEVDDEWGVNEKETNCDVAADSAMIICGAPPKQEEHGPDFAAMMFGDDLEMEEAETKTWSWSTGASIFDSVQESKTGSMDALFKWSSSCSDAFSAPVAANAYGGWSDSSPLGDSIFGLGDDATSSWSHGATGFDMWGASDPLGSARFDMGNLLLLQA